MKVKNKSDFEKYLIVESGIIYQNKDTSSQKILANLTMMLNNYNTELFAPKQDELVEVSNSVLSNLMNKTQHDRLKLKYRTFKLSLYKYTSIAALFLLVSGVILWHYNDNQYDNNTVILAVHEISFRGTPENNRELSSEDNIVKQLKKAGLNVEISTRIEQLNNLKGTGRYVIDVVQNTDLKFKILIFDRMEQKNIQERIVEFDGLKSMLDEFINSIKRADK